MLCGGLILIRLVCQLIDLLQQLQQRKTKLYDIGAVPK
jgi:hypothetical protein